jgi:hypothetical protein
MPLNMVCQPEVLVIPMTAYDQVLGLPWFNTHKSEIYRATGQLTSLRTPKREVEEDRSGMIVQWCKGRNDDSTYGQQSDVGGSTLTINLMSETLVDPGG